MILSTLVVIRAIYQFIRINVFDLDQDPIQIMIALSTFILVICQIIQYSIALPLLRSFGWKLFHVVGTSPQLIRLDYEALITLFLIRTFLFKTNFINRFSFSPYPLVVLIMVISLIMAHISIYVGVRRENKYVQILFLLFSVLTLVFVIYHLISLWIVDAGLILKIDASELIETKVVVSIILAVFILIRISLLISGTIMIFHFGSGLKEKVYGKDGVFYHYWRDKLLRYSSSSSHLLQSKEAIFEEENEE
eukprot:gene5698-9518_t